jgi:hypothetical protein
MSIKECKSLLMILNDFKKGRGCAKDEGSPGER